MAPISENFKSVTDLVKAKVNLNRKISEDRKNVTDHIVARYFPEESQNAMKKFMSTQTRSV
jgi:hypothetical protein